MTDGWDLDDFERIARQMKDRGISPASWNAYSAYWLASFQLGFGKEELLGPDGSVRFHTNAERSDSLTLVTIDHCIRSQGTASAAFPGN